MGSSSVPNLPLATLIFFLLGISPLAAGSPDLTNMGILLGHNRDTIKFIDNCISNLPQTREGEKAEIFTREMRELYLKALDHDYYAQIWYLQGDYSRSYRDVRKSQLALVEIHRRILVNYIDDSWVLLEITAPLVVRTRDRGARHLLRLGYRDLESSRLFFNRGFNIRRELFSNKIQHYQDGIKRIRRARRYALLALIEARLPHSEKPQFQVVTLDDVKNKREERLFKPSDYERVLNMLVNLMGRRLVPRTITRRLPRDISMIGESREVHLDLLEVHQDNYNRLVADRTSAWGELVSKIKVSQFNLKRVLPKRNSKNRYYIPREDSGPDKKAEQSKKSPSEPTKKPAGQPTDKPKAESKTKPALQPSPAPSGKQPVKPAKKSNP